MPDDLTFDYGDVAFVIVANKMDGDEVALLTAGSGAMTPLHGKILLMDNYRRITALWPSG